MVAQHPSSPCSNCPYRKDAPRRHWSPQEFRDLLASEDGPRILQETAAHPSRLQDLLTSPDSKIRPLGTIYSCHKQKDIASDSRGICAGWLLDQKKRGLPSIALRVGLSIYSHMRDALDAVNDGGHQLFSTVKAMCRANGVRSTPRKT